MKSHSDLHISRLPFACRSGAGLRGFVCRFRGKFPEISKQNGKCGCKLLILLGRNSTGSQEVASSILASSTIFNSLQTRHTIKGNKKVTANLTCVASGLGAVQRSAAFGPCSRYSAQVRSRWPGRLRRTRSEAVAAGSDAGRSLRYRRNYADHAGTHHPIMDVMRCVNLRR